MMESVNKKWAKRQMHKKQDAANTLYNRLRRVLGPEWIWSGGPTCYRLY